MAERDVLMQLVSDGETEVDACRRRVEMLQNQLSGAVDELKERQIELIALKRYASRRLGAVSTEQSPMDLDLPAPEPDWQGLNRPAAILSLLERTDEPLSPRGIFFELKQRGRDEKLQGVRNALTDLSKRHKVKSVGHGAWVLVTEADKQEVAQAS